jgi:hypothetical protein
MKKQELIKKLQELPDFEVVVRDQGMRDIYFNIDLELDIDPESGQEVIAIIESY